MSLKRVIENNLYLTFQENPDTYVSGGDIERLATEIGYLGSNGTRRARELVKEGRLERQEKNGHAWYRYNRQMIVHHD